MLDKARRSPKLRVLRNELGGRAYYCAALQGESDYNICINSDLTVSCNCRDRDGTGHIGDLSTQTLQEVFDGETARRFRETLARGSIPVLVCSECWELKAIPRREAARHVAQYHTPRRGIMVENTVLCNLRCASCDRKSVSGIRRKLSMSLEDIEKVARIIREYKIEEIAFHNLGEPFLPADVLEEVKILRAHNPRARIICSTNGVPLDAESKREAALLMDHVYFSIDGPNQEVMTRYQCGGNFEKSYRNMRGLVALRNSRGKSLPEIEWKYVVFPWNDAEPYITDAIRLAGEADVDIISFWPGGWSPANISQRFLNDPFFQRLGNPSWKGREIDFRAWRR